MGISIGSFLVPFSFLCGIIGMKLAGYFLFDCARTSDFLYSHSDFIKSLLVGVFFLSFMVVGIFLFDLIFNVVPWK